MTVLIKMHSVIVLDQARMGVGGGGSLYNLQHPYYHPTPDTVPGYCGDTSLGLSFPHVRETDECKEEDRREEEEGRMTDI